MGFDFNHTCPIIDKGIEDVMWDVSNLLNTIRDDINDPDHDNDKLIDDLEVDIIRVFKDSFEDVRNANSDIRSEAERQVNELENDVSELESEKEDISQDYEDAVNDLDIAKDRIDELEKEVDNLKIEIE